MVAFTSDCVYLFLYFGSGFFLLNCRKIILCFFFAYFFFEFGCFPLVCFSRTCFSFLFWIQFFFKLLLIVYFFRFTLDNLKNEKFKWFAFDCFMHTHFFFFFLVKRI